MASIYSSGSSSAPPPADSGGAAPSGSDGYYDGGDLGSGSNTSGWRGSINNLIGVDENKAEQARLETAALQQNAHAQGEMSQAQLRMLDSTAAQNAMLAEAKAEASFAQADNVRSMGETQDFYIMARNAVLEDDTLDWDEKVEKIGKFEQFSRASDGVIKDLGAVSTVGSASHITEQETTSGVDTGFNSMDNANISRGQGSMYEGQGTGAANSFQKVDYNMNMGFGGLGGGGVTGLGMGGGLGGFNNIGNAGVTGLGMGGGLGGFGPNLSGVGTGTVQGQPPAPQSQPPAPEPKKKEEPLPEASQGGFELSNAPEP